MKVRWGAVFGAVILALGLVMNAVAFVAPIDYAALGDLLYPGVFILTFVANATVVIPIPYVPVVIRVAEVAPAVILVVIAAAAGSMLGESVSYFVGQAGRGVISQSRVYRWMERIVHRPWLSALFLFVLAAPLNPFFDLAGLAAGALGIPYGIFAGAVFLGRFVRFAVVIWVGLGIVRF